MVDPDPALDVDAYLRRIGVDPATVDPPLDDPTGDDRATLARLQRAHVHAVPFETLAITGDPYGDGGGGGVSLSPADLREKVVDRERGGFCFELDGLFGRLLATLGVPVEYAAARVLDGDGDPGNPANHLVLVVDGELLVDAGLGSPKLRRPVALDPDAAPVEDRAGVGWRVRASDRPDADRRLQVREDGLDGDADDGDGWTTRYLLDTTPRDLGYFRATCDHLATAPESGFTGDPVATVALPGGFAKLTPDRFVREGPDGRAERAVDADGYHDLLADVFGIELRG